MNGLSFIPTFPSTIHGSTEQKIQTLADNLSQLSEQVSFFLKNLGPGNFDEAAMKEMFRPVYTEIQKLDERIKALEE